MSVLDWFPTLVAAAGNPNIVDELKKGKQLGDRNFKVHLDGYNQLEFITGKGPSNRHEIIYFAERRWGGPRNDYKYRDISREAGLEHRLFDFPILITSAWTRSGARTLQTCKLHNCLSPWRFVFVRRVMRVSSQRAHRPPDAKVRRRSISIDQDQGCQNMALKAA
jgi:hypothetical protein